MGFFLLWEEMGFDKTSIARHLLSAGIENIGFITIVSRGRLHETTCFHTTVRIYPAKSGTGYILYRKCCFENYDENANESIVKIR